MVALIFCDEALKIGVYRGVCLFENVICSLKESITTDFGFNHDIVSFSFFSVSYNSSMVTRSKVHQDDSQVAIYGVGSWVKLSATMVARLWKILKLHWLKCHKTVPETEIWTRK